MVWAWGLFVGPQSWTSLSGQVDHLIPLIVLSELIFMYLFTSLQQGLILTIFFSFIWETLTSWSWGPLLTQWYWRVGFLLIYLVCSVFTFYFMLVFLLCLVLLVSVLYLPRIIMKILISLFRSCNFKHHLHSSIILLFYHSFHY